jgi:PD-(D/E)XK nuclease superfamily
MDKTALDNFLSDVNVKHCLSNYQENNIFNILDLDEIRHSRVLAWLLNPRASHHSGDYFLKALLSSAAMSLLNEDKEIIEGYDFFEDWPIHDIESYGLSSSIITTEFKIGEVKNDSIDIAIFSPEHKFMIFIENKTGSREHSGQTVKYRKAMIPLAKKSGYDIGFIFLDWGESSAEDPYWASINYDWLTTALKSYIDKNTASNKILQLLSEYHDYLTDGNNSVDQSLTSLDFQMSSIASKHKDFLSTMVNELDCSSLKVSAIKSGFTGDDGSNETILYWQNYHFFDALFENNQWNLIKLELIKLLGENKGYEFDVHSNRIWIHNKSWYTFYGSDYDMDKGWVITPGLTEKDGMTFISLYASLGDINKTDEQLDSFFKAIGHKKQKSSFQQELSDNITEQVSELVRLTNDIDRYIHLLGK